MEAIPVRQDTYEEMATDEVVGWRMSAEMTNH